MRKAIAIKSAAVGTSAVVDVDDFGFDDDDLAAASGAIVTAATNNVMATWAGVDPTSTLGHRVVAPTRFREGTRLDRTMPTNRLL
jgi:hypothetical protein